MNPKAIINDGRMSAAQWLAVLVTVGLNALDGFDVLSISFASPGIAREWRIDPAGLGWVLAMEQLGMAVGSVLLGGVADRTGRRPTMLGCLVAMAAGMFGAGHAGNVVELLVARLLTGVGIGGMLASINAVSAEFCNNRWRSLAMALMVIGYPLGGVFGGLFVQRLLASGTWHDVFLFGAAITSLFIPLVWLLVPESVLYLDRLRAPGALARINRILDRLGHPPARELSPLEVNAPRASILDIFRPALITTTLLITLAYVAHAISFYFIIKWVPKIVVDMGFTASAAAGVLTWVNVGGAIGGVSFGLMAIRTGLRPLTIVTLLGASTMIIWFGAGAADIAGLTVKAALAGMFNNAGVAGMYLLFARVFPTHVRATGTGFAVGIGRGGAMLAPIIGGYLFQAGFGLSMVATFMAAGSFLGAMLLLALKVRPEE